MRSLISAVVLAAALFGLVAAVNGADDLSPQMRAQLCQEKKAGLAKLEEEAPQIRAQLAQREPELETARTEMDKWDKLSLAVVAGAIPDWLQTTAKLAGLNPVTYVNREHGKAANKVGPLRDEVTRLKQRQTEVGSQIFLLRDIVDSLRCDAPPVAGPQRPPVDFGAIDRLGQESRDQRYGGGSSPTSGSLGGPPGAAPTLIDQDYRGTAPSSAPGAAQAPAGGPGYGPYGPYGPGVGMVPVPGYSGPSSGYPMPPPGSPAQPCGGAGAGDCPPGQHREQSGGPCH